MTLNEVFYNSLFNIKKMPLIPATRSVRVDLALTITDFIPFNVALSPEEHKPILNSPSLNTFY